jgi:type II secretory pathway pseudopilin PulG
MLCLGPLTGIPAIITGHVAYNRSRRSPGLYSGGGVAMAGFILGYVSLIVGTAMLAIMLGITLPALAKAKAKAVEIKCINNMKMLGIAARIYATDNEDQFPPSLSAMGPAIGDPNVLVCPGDSSRRPMEGTDWSRLTDSHVTYQYLPPSGTEAELPDTIVFRCPVHGHVGRGDGSVHRGMGTLPQRFQ